MAIGEILLAQQKISERQLEDALVNQKFFKGKTGTQLVELGFINPPDLEEALSIQFGVPSVQESDLKYLDESCRFQFPVEMMQRYQFIPFKMSGNSLCVAMTRPMNTEALKFLEALVGDKILQIFSISEIRFHYYLFQHYHEGSDVRIRNLYFRFMKEKCKKSLVKLEEMDPIFELDASMEVEPTHSLYIEPGQLEALGLRPLERNEELIAESDEVWLQMQTERSSQAQPGPSEYIPEFANLADLGV